MSARKPLKYGHTLKMPNQGRYVICEKIGEGGLSLIYSAKTKNNGFPVVIKEFFPAKHAKRTDEPIRGEDGRIVKNRGSVIPDDKENSEHFALCLKAFEQEGRLGSTAHKNSFQIISFSDCGNGYAVMPCWSSDSCSFSDLVVGWENTPPASNDSVYPDLGRIHFALTAIKSLLSAVASVHAQNMLHLDISPSNVVWSGDSCISPENGAAFLTDFGCSVLMTEGSYPVEYVLSYSKEYAAPEYSFKDSNLTKATDIYSVGRLLMFLCWGEKAFYKHSILENLIKGLHIQERLRRKLRTIIENATKTRTDERYQSASEMQEAVTELLGEIPLHPINTDNSTAFSLYSLKAMLEGSLDTRYSWADELCDRRGLSVPIPETIYHPVTHIAGEHFPDDKAFLHAILPEEIFEYLWDRVSKEGDPQYYINAIMSGNYPKEWKAEISRRFEHYGLARLFAKCRTLLNSKLTFKISVGILLQMSGDDISYFAECYHRCAIIFGEELHKGLAVLTIFALLGYGEGGFNEFAQHSPANIGSMM